MHEIIKRLSLLLPTCNALNDLSAVAKTMELVQQRQQLMSRTLTSRQAVLRPRLQRTPHCTALPSHHPLSPQSSLVSRPSFWPFLGATNCPYGLWWMDACMCVSQTGPAIVTAVYTPLRSRATLPSFAQGKAPACSLTLAVTESASA